jgi:hypothetical protein
MEAADPRALFFACCENLELGSAAASETTDCRSQTSSRKTRSANRPER